MNQKRWDSLPADVKKAFESQSGEAWWREVGEIWTKSEDFGIGLAVKAGNKHIVLTDAELAAFREKLEPVVQRWINEVKGQGIDGAALVKAARENIAKYSK
jgi:TRAP-type C4-dicarboxylate transport system substrate-binding protein